MYIAVMVSLYPSDYQVVCQRAGRRKLYDQCLKPSYVWVIYMDGIFVIWSHRIVGPQSFHQHLNKQLHRAVEKEQWQAIFPWCPYHQKGRGLFTLAYQKPTQTEKHVPYHSHQKSRNTEWESKDAWGTAYAAYAIPQWRNSKWIRCSRQKGCKKSW